MLNYQIIKRIIASLNPRLALKTVAWVCWGAAFVMFFQTTGCKRDRSSTSEAPAVVAGNSMAPHFLGKHQSTVCLGCEFQIVSDVDASMNTSIVCPNCGLACSTENKFLARPADQVSINLGQLPERWQVIGFQRSNDDQASIKRVIGLPGETVWFEDGNVFVRAKDDRTRDDQPKLLKKNWAQQKATRILVHDNRFQDDNDRWSSLDPTSHLSENLPAKFRTAEHRWLHYQSKRCYQHSLKQAWSPRIEDSYGFNQGISRSLHPVDEVCLEFEFDSKSELAQTSGTELVMAIVASQQTYFAQFLFNQDSVDVQLFNGDDQVASVLHCQIDPELPTCAISNVDSQIIIAVGDEQVLSFEVSSPQTGSRVDSNSSVELLVSLQPASLAGSSGLRLWRDIYYFSPLSRDELLQRQSGSGLAGTAGYFVVGDNLPVSWDSRRWLLPRVDVKDILGVVDIGQ